MEGTKMEQKFYPGDSVLITTKGEYILSVYGTHAQILLSPGKREGIIDYHYGSGDITNPTEPVPIHIYGVRIKLNPDLTFIIEVDQDSLEAKK